MLLESKFDLASDERLRAAFDRLVEDIHGLEVAALENGNGLTQQKYEPAPIDSFADLTFPVDPKVQERAAQELKSVHSDLPLVSNEYVDGVLTYFQNRGRGFIENVLKLLEFDTCTVANGLEMLEVQDPSRGYTGPDVRALMPELGARVGIAVTSRMDTTSPGAGARQASTSSRRTGTCAPAGVRP